MKINMKLAFWTLVPALSASADGDTWNVSQMKCLLTNKAGNYQATFDSRESIKQVTFKFSPKDDPFEIVTIAFPLRRTLYSGIGDSPSTTGYALHAFNEEFGVNFEVDADGSAQDVDNDAWWRTKAVPSGLETFKCKTTWIVQDSNRRILEEVQTPRKP